MPADLDHRRNAIEAAEGTCPRCGTVRERDQRYCLECGLQLPAVSGTLPRLRRAWMRRVGWYPGDWVWISLLTLLVAAGGAASSIVLTVQRHTDEGHTFAATTASPVTDPTNVPTATTTVPRNTNTLPTAPEPTTTAPTTKPKPRGPANGRLAWPARENGWTIVLVSYPKTNGRPSALATASKAARARLHQVGILDSSKFASLQPGYLVVFTGIYGTKDDADAAVSTARQAGFGGAYSRQIAR
jgi:hypothetical protein